jgi:hypothetical protein
MLYLALFLTPDLIVLGSKKFKPTDNFVNFKKGTFNIRLDAYLYKIKETTIYGYIYPTDERVLIDVEMEPIKKGEKEYKINKGRLLTIKEKIEHGDLKLIVGENIIGQLARLAVMGVKQNWILILIVAVSVGIGAGGIGYSLGISHIPTYLNSTSINPTPFTVSPYPTATPITVYP